MDARKYTKDKLHEINHTALEVMNVYRFGKNSFYGSKRKDMRFEDEKIEDYINMLNPFLTRYITMLADKNSLKENGFIHNVIVALCADNELFLSTKQLLELSYFMNNFPFYTHGFIKYKEKKKLGVVTAFAKEENAILFFEYVIKRNFAQNNNNDTHKNIEEYTSSVLHAFNTYDKYIKLGELEFDTLLKTLSIENFDVPIDKMLDINFGREFYELVDNSVDSFFPRFKSKEYNTAINNLDHNIAVLLQK